MIFLKNKQAIDVPVSVVKAKIENDNIKILSKEVFSKSLSKLTGWPNEKIQSSGNWWFENIHEEDTKSVLNEVFNLILGKKDYVQVEYRFRKPDKSVIWITHTMLVLDRYDDYVVDVLTFWADVSLHKEKQDVFKIFEDNPYVGVLIYQDKFVYSNKIAEDLYGYTADELLDLEVKDLIHESIRDYVLSITKKRLTGELITSLSYSNLPTIHKNGKIIYVHTYTDRVFFNGENAGAIIIINNTKQHKMEMFGNMLAEINRILQKSKNETGFLSKMCEVFINSLPVTSILFAEFIEKENKFKKINLFKSKDNGGLIHNNSEYFDCDLEKFKDGIHLTYDINDLPFMDLNENYKGKKFTSLSFIFYKLNKPVYLFSIYFNFPYFFEDIDFIVNKLNIDINFALSTIEQNRNRNILYCALENSKDWVLITDVEGNIVYINDAVCDISGYSRDELLGENPRKLKSNIHEDVFYKELWDTITSGKIFSSLFTNKHKDGMLYQLDYTISPISEEGEITHFVAVSKDVTKEKYLEQEIQKFKYMDFLTGINNRDGFFRESANVSNKFIKVKPHNMLFILDIKNFSNLNKIHGNYVCDNLLLKITDRLKNSIFNEDVIGRTGSDEFSILLRLKDTSEVTSIIGKILELFNEPFKIDDLSITITVNIGAVVFDAREDLDENSIKEEFNKALSALVIAKKAGENNFRFFNEKINITVVKDFEKNNLIRDALENNWFRLFLQPYYDSKSTEIVGFEGLLRINHPEKGLIFPGEFIDALENFYKLPDVEKWIINKASSYLNFFEKKYSRDLSISINISAESFNNETIYNLLKEAEGLKPLHLEITERLFMGDINKIENLLSSIKKMNHLISIDDFGTEYSSLAYLYKLSIDRVKIDISFVRNMLKNNKQFVVVRNIIRLCKELKLETLAEGVETEEQFKTLQMLGCDLLQGYYFSKPVKFEDAVKLLDDCILGKI